MRSLISFHNSRNLIFCTCIGKETAFSAEKYWVLPIQSKRGIILVIKRKDFTVSIDSCPNTVFVNSSEFPRTL